LRLVDRTRSRRSARQSVMSHRACHVIPTLAGIPHRADGARSSAASTHPWYCPPDEITKFGLTGAWNGPWKIDRQQQPPASQPVQLVSFENIEEFPGGEAPMPAIKRTHPMEIALL
jgi:hypothetical protein